MEVPWSPSIVSLDAVQAVLVALPAAGLPLALRRFAGRWWALIPPASIIGVVYGITALPGLADGLTWLALLACPPLAAAALGWAMHGARPAYALAAIPLLAVATAWSGALGGHLAATAITALSCVTLARLLRGVAPAVALKLGIVAMAVADTILILAEELQEPAHTLNAAVPAAHLPRLQVAIVDPSSLGYGDLFLAAVLGALLAVEATRRQQTAIAAVLVAFAVAFDALFLVLDTLPGTVPVALALGVWEVVRRRAQRAPDAAPAPRAARA
ncbi:MAG TPA: hypothetical protein VFR97_03000 [Capillimicrobium sp.]|nr:hypothetical protein [Capillimicrobium sp.]